MSGRFEPFELSDLDLLEVQEKHAWLLPIMRQHPLSMQPLMVGPYSWTYWLPAGVPAGAAGILPDGHAWALLGPDMKRHMVPVVGAMRCMIRAYPGAILAEIDDSYPEAVRLARVLGFTRAGGLWRHG